MNNKENQPISQPINECSGFRLAYIRCLETLKFESLFGGEFFITSLAKCDKGHAKVEKDCRCGFYSFKDLKAAIREIRFFKKTYILKVENYGEIVEHEKGWRSSEQVVTRILLPKKCSQFLCSKSTSNLALESSGIYRHLCEKHAKRYKQSYSIFYLENILDQRVDLI